MAFLSTTKNPNFIYVSFRIRSWLSHTGSICIQKEHRTPIRFTFTRNLVYRMTKSEFIHRVLWFSLASKWLVSVFRRPNGLWMAVILPFYQVYGRNSKIKTKMAYGSFDSERTIDRVIHIFGALILASIRLDSLPCFRLKIVLWMCDFRCTHLTRNDTKRVRRARRESERERRNER